MHKIRTYPVCDNFDCFIYHNIYLVESQNVPGLFFVNDYSSQKTGCKLERFSGSAGFSYCTKLIWYGYHFRMDIKIFYTVDQETDESRDTVRALDAGYC